MYEPSRQTLNFHHIEQINTMVFHYRELSRQTTSQLGVIPNKVIGQLRSLNDRIVGNIDLIEEDMVRNERAPFEAKWDFYCQELQDMRNVFGELYAVLYNVPLPPTQPQPQN
ncbi:unnamed protein product [Caenorhabditis brenneri]